MRFFAVVLCCFLLSLVGIFATDVSNVISKPQFENMLKHRNDPPCRARGFYTYEAFIAAARSFPGFGTTGDFNTRKREIAAFLAQTAHETKGGYSPKDNQYSWGYCFNEVSLGNHPPSYCVPSQQWPCAQYKSYYGRGPMKIFYNYNYGQAGKTIGVDLLNNPELVTKDPIIAFKTAIWVWMTPQSPKPSSHDVITGQWKPSPADISAGRVPGFGVITNILTAGTECGSPNEASTSRIGFYKRFLDILGLSHGAKQDCKNQRPFGS